MPLNIRDPEVHELARQVADATGETMTQAIKEALRERLANLRTERENRVRAILDWAAEWRSRPVIDPRSLDEILDYDENGLPR